MRKLAALSGGRPRLVLAVVGVAVLAVTAWQVGGAVFGDAATGDADHETGLDTNVGAGTAAGTAAGDVPRRHVVVEAQPLIGEPSDWSVDRDGAPRRILVEVRPLASRPSDPAADLPVAAPEASAVDPSTHQPTGEPTVGDRRPAFDIADPHMTAGEHQVLPFDDPAGRPRIAVIVAGLGVSAALTDAAIAALPPAVTMAVAAQAAEPATTLAAARGAGHEVLMTVPMEPIAYPRDDPGPNTLLTSLAPGQNLARLELLLGQGDGYVGVINEMGARFTMSPAAMRPVLSRLGDNDLLFVERRTAEDSEAGAVSHEIGLRYLASDRIFDVELAPDVIDLQFIELEHLARDRGSATAVIEPTPMIIDRLAAWATTLPGKGLVLAPVTAVATTEPTL